jgi:hypothetical protein
MSGGALIPPGPIRVVVATKPVDFRKGMDELAALVKEQMQADPFSGCRRVKLIFWDSTGLVPVRQRVGRRQVPLAARHAAVGCAIGSVDRGSGLHARGGARRVLAPEAVQQPEVK